MYTFFFITENRKKHGQFLHPQLQNTDNFCSYNFKTENRKKHGQLLQGPRY